MLRVPLNAKRKGVICVRQLFYGVARHSVVLRALLALSVIAAMAIALGGPEVALAGGLDGFAP
jgi:hypothetical protein